MPRDMPVATVHGKSSEEGEGDTPEDERVANMALIADAPAMLDLLRESRELNGSECSCLPESRDRYDPRVVMKAVTCWNCRARALLDKHGRG